MSASTTQAAPPTQRPRHARSEWTQAAEEVGILRTPCVPADERARGLTELHFAELRQQGPGSSGQRERKRHSLEHL
jgi:hypothetical protein